MTHIELATVAGICWSAKAWELAARYVASRRQAHTVASADVAVGAWFGSVWHGAI